jgi:hypothetical protein
LQLNGTHQLLVYADDNRPGERVHNIEKNTDVLVTDSKEISLEVNDE